MKKIKLLVGSLGGLSVIGGATAIIVACGSENQDYTRVRVAYESAWRGVMQNALRTLTTEEQAKFDFVEIQDGQAVTTYIPIVQRSPSDYSTADLFPAPVDRFSSLNTARIVYPLGTNYDETQYDENSVGLIDGQHYAYPINVESVIQIYQKGLTGLNGYSTDTGWDTYDHGFEDPKFISQWANLWQASPYLTGSMLPANATADQVQNAKNLWVAGTAKNYTYPWRTPDNNTNAFKTAATKLWQENNDLRTAGTGTSAWKASLANNPSGTNRDSLMRENFTAGNINGMIEGPWIVNELVARIVITAANPSDESAIAAKLDKIGASVLPNIAANQPARHFKGGWGYGINAQRLQQTGDETARNTKLALETKFLKALTAKERAVDWFKTGGKISAAKGAAINFTTADAKALQIANPLNSKEMLDFSKYGDTFATALSSLYTRIITAVVEQSTKNVEQPSGFAWDGMWDTWDKFTMSNSEVTTAAQFWTKLNEQAAAALVTANSK